MLDVY